MSDDLKMFAGICMIVFGTFGFLHCLASAADQTTTGLRVGPVVREVHRFAGVEDRSSVEDKG